MQQDLADSGFVTLLNTLAFECVDVAATLAAAWALARMVVDRPALVLARVQAQDRSAADLSEVPAIAGPAVDDASVQSDAGITWPESAWTRLAA